MHPPLPAIERSKDGMIATLWLNRPEDVAAVVAFLCSDAAEFITGQVISVNGGLHMP